jgi:hypothetical protein
MKLKKSLFVLLALLMSMIILTGCSQVEKDFYALQKEISTWDAYVSEGEITLTVNQLPEEISAITGESPLVQDIILKLLQDLKLTHNIKMDVERQLMSISIYLELYDKAGPRELLTIISKDDMLYIRVDKIAELLSMNSEFTPYRNALGDNTYLTISREEMVDLLGPEDGNLFMNYLALGAPEQLQAQNTLYFTLLEGLMNEVYGQYETGLIEKKGDKFTLNLTPQEAVELVGPFILYSLDHADQLETYLITTVENLTDEELLLLELDPAQREDYLQEITEFINEIKMSGTELLNVWTDSRPMIANEVISLLGATKLSASFQKKDSSTYDSQLELLLQIKGKPESTQPLELVYQIKDHIKKTNNFEVTVPQEGLISWTDCTAQIPWTVNIEPEYGFYYTSHGLDSDFGDLEAVIDKDQTMVPFRQMAAILDEEAGWDQEKRQAYVEREGIRIYFEGRIQDNLLLVPVRAFEKLGWEVNWEPYSGFVTLIKYQ